MLTKTAYLLLEAHTYFKEFGYRPKSNDINFDEFLECAIKTIVRTKTFDDVHEAIRMYYFIYTQFDKICNKAKKYDYYWESLDYKGSKTINLVKKEEARGSYYVTNALTEDYNNVYVLSTTVRHWRHYCACHTSRRRLTSRHYNGMRSYNLYRVPERQNRTC